MIGARHTLRSSPIAEAMNMTATNRPCRETEAWSKALRRLEEPS
jgi:hypothetical protein